MTRRQAKAPIHEKGGELASNKVTLKRPKARNSTCFQMFLRTLTLHYFTKRHATKEILAEDLWGPEAP